MASTKESTTLNEAQTKFLAILMRNVKGKPDIDFDAVSKELGITQKSAKERFRLLSVKMGWKDGPSTPKKPTGVTKRTPSKVGGGKRAGKDKAQLTPDDRDESDEEVNKMDSSDELVKDEGEA
ncbi:hypothetical protein KVR01_003947 [Diaporthe batatas]|uniref:uncharacterized protein n=1 Tax=Diaporthe batatas TaxID=748121 RepID=UPI001D04125C|nr:uncharacterized protein KVR01_003947 [Diaporthe batatas]KAG8168258.1 hypothetical protein KVR01_003947 [Diaporthe batatas]